MDSWDIVINSFRLVLTLALTSYVVQPLSLADNPMCSKLEICKEILPYNMTIFPNILNQTSQDDAMAIYYQMTPLIETGCSKDLHHFLCFQLTPPCTIMNKFIPVCQPFCQKAVTAECLDILKRMKISVPQVLECGNLPSEGLCVGENQTSAGSGAVNIYPTRGSYPWYPEDNQYDDNIKIDLYFLAKTGSNIQLLVIRSPNDMDTMNLYSRVQGNIAATLDYYLPERFVYWASPLDGRIYRGSFIVETLRDVVPIIDTASSNVESLVVDWNLCVLFWSESVPVARIRTASLSGRGVKTVVQEKMMLPLSLTVDPTEGRLFWIDRRGDEFSSYSTIESFSVVTNRREFVFNITTEGSRARSLVADIEGKKLFWIDARTESLHSIKYDGSDHKVLLENHKHLQQPDSLVVSGDKAIWVDKNAKSLIWANKNTGKDVMPIKRFDSYAPQNIRLYGKSTQVNTTSYTKEKLSEEWQELSSRENQGVPDLDEYGFKDDYNDYDDDSDLDDDRGRAGGKTKTNDKKNNGNVIRFDNIVTAIGFVLILFSMYV